LLPVETSGKIFLFIAGMLAIFLFCFLIYCIPLYARSQYPHSEKSKRVVQFAIYFIFLIAFAWIANLSRARHILPLLLILPVALVCLFEIKQLSRLKKVLPFIFVVLFTLNIASWISNFKKANFNPTTVVKAMERNECKFFYASYWCAYPIMFESKGLLCGSPMLLPYHEILSDRRPDYTNVIRQEQSPAFFFGQYETTLKQGFVNFLAETKISSEQIESNEGTLFFHFSKPVDPVIETRWNTTFAVRKSEIN
jgi:hypothetical protein